MKRLHLTLIITAVILGGVLSSTSAAQESKTGGSQKMATPQAKQSAPEPSLDGGSVFQRYCGQCHGERYPTERIKDKWTVIATHMRVRGQLTGKETEAVLQYLHDNARQEKRAPEPVTSTREETKR